MQNCSIIILDGKSATKLDFVGNHSSAVSLVRQIEEKFDYALIIDVNSNELYDIIYQYPNRITDEVELTIEDYDEWL